MHFDYTPKVQDLRARVDAFMQEHVFPNERAFYDEIEENTRKGARWTPTRIVEDLKVKAKAAGLWNLFLPDSPRGAGLKNIEYAPLAELMGRVPWASEVFNCSAPDTGNMETIERYGSPEQKKRWLEPLLAGEIRSAFCMTEPDVASSDATNIRTEIKRDGNEMYIESTASPIRDGSGAGDVGGPAGPDRLLTADIGPEGLRANPAAGLSGRSARSRGSSCRSMETWRSAGAGVVTCSAITGELRASFMAGPRCDAR